MSDSDYIRSLPARLRPLGEKILAYYAQPGNGTGGYLHVVLDDGNVGEDSVRFCREEADAAGDAEGVGIADDLLALAENERRLL